MQTQMDMQACPKCSAENLITARFCSVCKSKLPKQTLPKAIKEEDGVTNKLDNTSAIPDIAALGLVDETYQIADEEVETLFMDALIADDAAVGDGAIRMKGNLILTEHETGRKFVIEPENLKEAVIGRASQQSDFNPVIDLSPLQAHKLGVSRRHATISYRDAWLVIIDHSSTNGTYINGHRLVPEQPRVIRDKDTIRIGAILLHVAYGS